MALPRPDERRERARDNSPTVVPFAHAGRITNGRITAIEFTERKFVLKRKIIIGCLLALGGCGGGTALTHPIGPADVSALEVALTIADTLALNYVRLPGCPTATPACSVPATKQMIKDEAQKAHDAVKTLQSSSAAGAPMAFAVAQAALTTLRASIPVMPATN